MIRENLNEIASFMCYEVFKDLKVYDDAETYKTPTGVTLPRKKLENKIILKKKKREQNDVSGPETERQEC